MDIEQIQSNALNTQDDDLVTPSNALKKTVSLEKTTPSNALKSNALNSQSGEVFNLGYCEHCSKEFIKNTTWQRFCTPECRDESYYLRTGKKWRGKVTA